MAKDKKKGLGTGLEALFAEDVPLEENEAEETEVTQLPIMKIEPRADQPRRRFDEEALEELAESIATHGMIQPITVRPQESGYYQIIAGERRWRAARKAGLETVPVHILTVDEQKAMEMALVENLQREDLNPIEEAQGYEILQQTYGMTQEAVAQSVGKSRPAIANAMRLLMLSEPVRQMVGGAVSRTRQSAPAARAPGRATEHRADDPAEAPLRPPGGGAGGQPAQAAGAGNAEKGRKRRRLSGRVRQNARKRARTPRAAAAGQEGRQDRTGILWGRRP